MITNSYLKEVENKAQRLEKILSEKNTSINYKEVFDSTDNELFNVSYSIASNINPHISLILGIEYINSIPYIDNDTLLSTIIISNSFIKAGIPVSVTVDFLGIKDFRNLLKLSEIEEIIPIYEFNKNLNENDILKSINEHWHNSKPPVTHTLAINTLGPNSNDFIYNINGEKITNEIAHLYKLFLPHDEIETIAISNNINQLGFGKFSSSLQHKLSVKNKKFVCSVYSDYLLSSFSSALSSFCLIGILSLIRYDLFEKLNETLNTNFLFRILNDYLKIKNNELQNNPILINSINIEDFTIAFTKIKNIIHEKTIYTDERESLIKTFQNEEKYGI